MKNEAVITNLKEVLSITAADSTHPAADTCDTKQAWRYVTGCQFGFFNGLFDDESGTHLNEHIQFFTDKNIPFTWWWTKEEAMPAQLEKILKDHQFERLGELAGMMLELEQIQPTKASTEIQVKLVETAQEYQTFIDILGTVFELSEGIRADLRHMFQSYGLNGKFNHYLGLYQGEPVATATSYLSGETVGLYNGATLEAARRKGVCRAIAERALLNAKEQGATWAITQLMPSAMARGVTDDLGFKNVRPLFAYSHS